jgi:hypothetical protein
VGSYLHDNRPIRQSDLRGHKHNALATPTQLSQKLEAFDGFSGFGQSESRMGIHDEGVAGQQDFQLGAILGEALNDLLGHDFQARFMALADLFVDQSESTFRTIGKFWMACQELLGPRPLFALPGRYHFFDELSH